jgi:hypothetical protein
MSSKDKNERLSLALRKYFKKKIKKKLSNVYST